jgi:YegS/Rv2252/BmrU family lipid kinase
MKPKVRFIINPISGGKKKDHFPEAIRNACLEFGLEADIFLCNSIAETKEKTKEAVQLNYHAVIAVGGDGTINLIGSELINTQVALGIIPMGSGNGLARSLHIPFDIKKAIKTISDFNLQSIDTGEVNGIPFINLSGIGFDAHVAGIFHNSQRRGLFSYAKIILREFNRFKQEPLKIHLDGNTIHVNAFLFTVCNGPQFGNNAIIAPLASLRDGIFHITILKRLKWFDAPRLAYRLFKGTIHLDSNTDCYSAKEIKIVRSKNGLMNIDGEPIMLSNNLHIEMRPLSLNVIVPA